MPPSAPRRGEFGRAHWGSKTWPDRVPAVKRAGRCRIRRWRAATDPLRTTRRSAAPTLRSRIAHAFGRAAAIGLLKRGRPAKLPHRHGRRESASSDARQRRAVDDQVVVPRPEQTPTRWPTPGCSAGRRGWRRSRAGGHDVQAVHRQSAGWRLRRASSGLQHAAESSTEPWSFRKCFARRWAGASRRPPAGFAVRPAPCQRDGQVRGELIFSLADGSAGDHERA